MYNKWFLWLECITLFIVIPLLLWIGVISTPLIMIPLLILSVPVTIWLGKTSGFNRTTFWQGEVEKERQQLCRIIKRFLLLTLLLFIIIYLFYPEHLFDFPLRMPMIWLMLMVFYPLLSVYPQELLYRAFFLRRYELLFNNKKTLLFMNAVLFGWMHIVFHNLLAVIFTFVAAFLFADTYQKSKSLRLVSLEHALYGNLLFTFGYGEAFLYKPFLKYFIV